MAKIPFFESPETKEKLNFFLVSVEIPKSFVPKIKEPISAKNEEEAIRIVENKLRNERGEDFIEKYKCKIECEKVSEERYKLALSEKKGKLRSVEK